MTYTKTTITNNRNGALNIIWFNPPSSHKVKTNNGNTFLKLIKIHFLRDHRLYKMLNRNTLRLSYSCLSNMSSVIKEHNCKVLSTKNVDRLCNCRNEHSCLLDGESLQTYIVYKAGVITN